MLTDEELLKYQRQVYSLIPLTVAAVVSLAVASSLLPVDRHLLGPIGCALTMLGLITASWVAAQVLGRVTPSDMEDFLQNHPEGGVDIGFIQPGGVIGVMIGWHTKTDVQVIIHLPALRFEVHGPNSTVQKARSVAELREILRKLQDVDESHGGSNAE